jgi:hypothetical protein
MSDKLQFVAGFHYSSTVERHDKLKFVGHFWIRQQSPAHRKLTKNAKPRLRIRSWLFIEKTRQPFSSKDESKRRVNLPVVSRRQQVA